MDNLNLDNFWNPLKEKYPLAVEAFCKWIDEYKKEVGWGKLFNQATVRDPETDDLVYKPAPKLHEIPYEMQLGIIGRFIAENLAGFMSPAEFHDGMINDTQNMFKELELKLKSNG